MKLEIENAVFEYLKKVLNRDLSAMLVRGHSTILRPVPYIVVDCSEPKPFGTLSAADGLFELVLEIRIADSAHDIDYRIQQKRVNAVFGALENFECSANRISPEYINNDGSTSGRIALWMGGLKMVAQAPVYGWGVDKSGEEYINWYQDFSDERKYAGMVNSYLHVAVERGLPALFAALSILAFLFFADFRLWRKNGDLFVLALGLALLSLCVSNIFSTLWIVSSIRYTGITVAAVSVIYAIFKGRKILAFAKIAILSIASAASICLCLYLAGLALQPKFISKHSDHITLTPDRPTDKRIAVIADKDTFGEYFGKTLRNTYVKAKPETVLDIYYEIPENAEVYDKFIVTGKFAQAFQPPTSAKIVYINPIGNPPPPSGLTNATIYLPRFDIYNQNSKWINAAKKANVNCIFTKSPSAQISNTLLQLVF